MRLRVDHRQPIGDPEIVRQRGERLVRLVAPRSARAADDDESVAMSLPRQRGERADRDVGPLQRLDAADHEQERAVAR